MTPQMPCMRPNAISSAAVPWLSSTCVNSLDVDGVVLFKFCDCLWCVECVFSASRTNSRNLQQYVVQPGWHAHAYNPISHAVAHVLLHKSATCTEVNTQLSLIIIIKLPDQAIASTPSAPRPLGAEDRGSTAPLCLQLLRTSQAFTRYAAMLLDTSRQTPLLPQT
jgi:hypothetical protein